MQILKRGAEAVIVREGNLVIKRRIKKGYRIEVLDELLRKRRTKQEANMINEARRAGVPTPTVFEVVGDELRMEFLDGKRIKDLVADLSDEKLAKLCEEIGRNVAKLHNFGIVHGDLTTSNFILKEGKVYFIDFGLAFHSNKIEDMAYDLYVLKQAIIATHSERFDIMWQAIVKAYASEAREAEAVLEKLGEIELRGRYKKR